MQPYLIVAAIVGAGGRVALDGDGVRVWLPEGIPPDLAATISAHKPAIVAALAGWRIAETVQHIAALADDELATYRAALAHDLAALAIAETERANRTRKAA